jgi:hypothetical protein
MSRVASPEIPSTRAATGAIAAGTRPALQAYRILHIGFAALPIIAGVDKFTHFLVEWDKYLAPIVTDVLPVTAETFMLVVGVIEVVAGLLVAAAPGIGGFVVAAWLWGIIMNLLLVPGYYDIALRDFGLSLGALALALLAREFSPRRN